jgi:hypothetical protein
MRIFFIISILLLFYSNSFAQSLTPSGSYSKETTEVTVTTGETITGKVVEETNNYYKIKSGKYTYYINKNETVYIKENNNKGEAAGE